MPRKLNVGDVVYLKTDMEEIRDIEKAYVYDSPYWPESLAEFFGKPVTVKNIIDEEKGWFGVEEDGGAWTWYVRWLQDEPVTEAETPDTEVEMYGADSSTRKDRGIEELSSLFPVGTVVVREHKNDKDYEIGTRAIVMGYAPPVLKVAPIEQDAPVLEGLSEIEVTLRPWYVENVRAESNGEDRAEVVPAPFAETSRTIPVDAGSRLRRAVNETVNALNDLADAVDAV